MSLLKRDKNNRIYFELTRAANTHYTQNEHTHTHTHVDRKSGINPDLSRRVIWIFASPYILFGFSLYAFLCSKYVQNKSQFF